MKTAALPLTVLLLVGCSTAGNTSSSSSSPSPAATTASQVATNAGCTGYQAETVQAFTTETGSCDLDGQTLYVMTFPDTTTRDQWLQVAKTAGGSFGQGERWVIQGDDRATVEKAVQAAGGSML